MPGDRLGGRRTLKVGSFLDEFEKDGIKQKIDIVGLFEHFGVQLDKKGKSYLGKCPWHEDKTPSLSVDKVKGLYNCFGCGESGDQFSLVEKMRGCDFKEALKFLKGLAGKVDVKPAGKKKAKERPQPKKQETNPTALGISLDTATERYHKTIYASKPAMSYFTKTRMLNPELLTRFKIGYSDGSLLKISTNGHREAFTALNIFKTNDKGKIWEHFTGCLTFPITDPSGKTVHVYGRKITPKAEKPHLYLSGSHKSVFNRKASCVYDEILLTESIIDCLSLMSLGIENVQPLYGVGTLTEEHIRLLKEDRVKTVVLALDKDEAGKTWAEKHKVRLLSEGFGVKIIFPTEGKDWNDYLLGGGTKEQVLNLIQATELSKKPGPLFEVKKEGIRHIFKINPLTYILFGVTDTFSKDLRVNMKAEKEGKLLALDQCNLYSSQSRTRFSHRLAGEADMEVKKIENDLLLIVAHIEKEREKKLKEQYLGKPEIVITESERQAGLELLKDKNTGKRITEAFEVLGYIGEEINVLLAFFVGLTRFFESPLSLYIQSGSSTGKSYLLDTLLKLLPEEDVIVTASFSDKAMYYFDDDAFLHKVFMIGESVHDAEIEGQIRQMQSENRLTRWVVMKDEKTGEMKTQHLKKEVKLAIMTSSTVLSLNPENASRCLVAHTNESPKQTRLVQQRLRMLESDLAEDIHRSHQMKQIISKFVTAQRLLKPVKMYNPIARYIRFPSTRPTMRRAQKHFLSLNNAIGFWRQMQKQQQEIQNPYDRQICRGYACDLDDYQLARTLYVEGIMKTSRDDLSNSVIGVYEAIRSFVKTKSKENNIKAEEVSFIQRQVRAYTGLGKDSIKKYIKQLVDYEYLRITSGRRHGTKYSYALIEDAPIEDIDINIIPSKSEIETAMAEGNLKNA